MSLTLLYWGPATPASPLLLVQPLPRLPRELHTVVVPLRAPPSPSARHFYNLFFLIVVRRFGSGLARKVPDVENRKSKKKSEKSPTVQSGTSGNSDRAYRPIFKDIRAFCDFSSNPAQSDPNSE